MDSREGKERQNGKEIGKRMKRKEENQEGGWTTKRESRAEDRTTKGKKG